MEAVPERLLDQSTSASANNAVVVLRFQRS
jgi:hypothetical protein